MLGRQKKSKWRKRSLGLGGAGSPGHVEDRVVMVCDDIPSEESSWDSGRGSHGSGIRSGADEVGQGWRSRSFNGPPRSARNYPVHRVQSKPVHGTTSVLHIRQM